MKAIAAISTTLAITLIVTSAKAQDSGYAIEGAVPNVALTGFYGGGYYPAWGGASTVAEGALRGQADLVRAWGDNAYMNSLAAVNTEVARQKNIENRLQWVQTYFEMRRTNEAARAAQRPTAMSLGQSQQYARMLAPQRLSPYQIEPVSGRIHWPAALQGPEFAEARKALQQIFASRDVHTSGVGNTTDSQVAEITAAMRDALKANIDAMTSSEYLAARKFVDGLAYEARFAPGVEGLASN